MAGTLVPLSELVHIEESRLDISLHRKNLKPLVYVLGEMAGTQESPVYAILDMGAAIDQLEGTDGAVIEQYFRDEPWPEAHGAVRWDGEWSITYEVFRDLGGAFGAALILIYILITGWFGSFRTPLVMMIAIPLAGIMVRNSVLLIDFVDLALAQGKTLGEAVIEAGAVRFRPILLTAGTVVVGAVVILFDPIFQGLAIALMTGAIASTVLTLLVVPLVHFMVESHRYDTPLPPGWSGAHTHPAEEGLELDESPEPEESTQTNKTEVKT